MIHTELLGMRLEDALDVLQRTGETKAEILDSSAPRAQREHGIRRVVRVREGQLTVCTFLDTPMQNMTSQE